MFGFSHKKEAQQDSFVYDQAVIITIPQASEIGDEGAYEEVADFEEKIASLLPENSGIDGHEFGENEATIYIYGPDADAIYDAIKSEISSFFSGCGARATLQYGQPDDPDTKEKSINIQ